MSATTGRQVFLLVTTAVVAGIAFKLFLNHHIFERDQALIPALSRHDSLAMHLPDIIENENNIKKKENNSVRLDSNDWGERFRHSTDYYEFVSEAAADAFYNKDGRAAFFVGEAMSACAGTLKLAQQDSQLEQNFDVNYDAIAPKALPWMKDQAKREFQRCMRLAKEDAFSSLPPRTEGYTLPKYWYDQAIASGDPVAKAHQALVDLSASLYTDASGRVPLVDEARAFVRDAVTSGNPEAMFSVGRVLSNSRYSADPVRGIAITIAACELGYDCSANNPANVFSVCKNSGTCPADADYSYYIQQSVGAEKYAQAYSKAQDIKDLLSRNDKAGIEQFVELDGSLFVNR